MDCVLGDMIVTRIRDRSEVQRVEAAFRGRAWTGNSDGRSHVAGGECQFARSDDRVNQTLPIPATRVGRDSGAAVEREIVGVHPGNRPGSVGSCVTLDTGDCNLVSRCQPMSSRGNGDGLASGSGSSGNDMVPGPVATSGVSRITTAAVERDVIIVDRGDRPRSVGSRIACNPGDCNLVSGYQTMC